MPTIRQQMIEALKREVLSARELSQMLGIGEKEVLEHLPHIARSVSSQRQRLVIIPSRCLSCGYTFAGRKRVSKPSRCHRCKHEHISDPRFELKYRRGR